MWLIWLYDIKVVPVRWKGKDKGGIRKGDERRDTEIQSFLPVLRMVLVHKR